MSTASMWKRLAGNCHLTRRVSEAIAEKGFAVTPIGAKFVPGTPRTVGWMEWGGATKV